MPLSLLQAVGSAFNSLPLEFVHSVGGLPQLLLKSACPGGLPVVFRLLGFLGDLEP
jgi:hypothetical protein